jgi:Ferritin-like domain
MLKDMLKDKKENFKKQVSRRQVLKVGGISVAVGALGPALPAAAGIRFAGDLAILNVALGLEHQAIAAYDAGAKSKLLSADQLKIAVSFQTDHKRHRDVLVGYIRRFGGTPVDPKPNYDFGTITSATDIVKLAQRLEDGAEAAYLANAGKLENREILNAAVPILEDEVRHNTVFKQLLGMDVTERLKY